MLDQTRLRNPALFAKIVTPDKAAELIEDGMNVGVSGFTPSGYPKQTTMALARAIKAGKKMPYQYLERRFFRSGSRRRIGGGGWSEGADALLCSFQ